MRRLALGFPWFGGVRLRAKAIVIGAVALVCGTAHVTQAGINVWTSYGPYGGHTYALAIDATTSPATVYAGTDGGVFKSTSGGSSWSAINTNLTSTPAYVLAIDATTSPATVYAGTVGGGVFKSTSGGSNWSAVTTNLTSTDVRALAIDATTSPATVYAGTDGGYVKLAATTGLRQVDSPLADPPNDHTGIPQCLWNNTREAPGWRQ